MLEIALATITLSALYFGYKEITRRLDNIERRLDGLSSRHDQFRDEVLHRLGKLEDAP